MATKRAPKKSPTLSSLLPKDQAKLLTPSLRRMTKQQLEKAVNGHNKTGKSAMTLKDIAGLRKLILHRINGGQSAFTWSSHAFADRDDKQDPSTCICFVS